MNHLCKFFISTSVSTLLIACGGGGGNSTGSPSPPPVAASVSVNGFVVAGLAQCNVSLQDLDGREVARDADGSEVTGDYELSVSAQDAVFILSATNCNYEDELTGNRITNGTFRAGLVLEAGESDITIQQNISPISEISLRGAIQSAGGQDLITASIMTEETERFTRLFGGENFDPNTTTPIIATDIDSTRTDSAGETFGLVLAAISGAGDVENVIANFIAQLDLNTMEATEESFGPILEGALAFENSGRSAATIPTAQSLAPLTNNGVVSGIAPVFIEGTESISVLLGETLSIDLKTFFTDEDSAITDVVVAGLPESFEIIDGNLTGTAELAHDGQLVLTAFDETGNAASGVVLFRVTTPEPEADDEVPTVSFAPSDLTLASADTATSVLSTQDNVGITSGPNVSCTNGGMWSNDVFTAPSTTTDLEITCTASVSDAEDNVGTGILSVNVTGIAAPPPPPPSDTIAPRLAFIPNVLTLASGDGTFSSLQASDNVRVTNGPNVSCTNGGSWADGVFTAPVTQIDLISVCTASASDAAGNTGTITLTVTVEGIAEDQIDPVLSFSPNALSVAADETAPSTLSASDNVAITSGPNVSCTNGGSWADGVFTAPVTQIDLISVCTASASDAAGNTGTITLTVTVEGIAEDQIDPVLSFSPDELSVAADETAPSTLSASDNVAITSGPNVSCTNGGSWADGVFTAPVTQIDLISVCTASASDAAGNTGTITLTVTVEGIAEDQIDPVLSFSPDELSVTADETAPSTLSASDNVAITSGPNVSCTNGGSWADGVFTAPVTQIDLISVCTASASDAAGNTGTITLTVTVEGIAEDQIDPVLSFSPDELSVAADETAPSTLSASDNVAITSGPNVSCTNGGSWSNGVFTAPETVFSLTSVCTASASDEAGNTGTTTLTVSVTGNSPPPPSSFDTRFDTRSEASRFLSVAGFGGSSDDLDALVNTNAEDWLSDQFSKPYVSYLSETDNQISAYAGSNRFNGSHRVIFWNNVIAGDDPLRHRMTLALSQIVVASEMVLVNDARRMAYYMNAIGENAFGNYRQLLEDVTYSPAMGQYLTYLGNQKGNPATGRMPDENYAREILQLFSIGINELNMDGTQKLRSDGTQIETYTNADIVGLARVFTGMTFGSGGDRYAIPMVVTSQGHSELEKTFLGQTIPAGTPGEASIDQALDIIFEHPNVAPFVSRQLIQRFTSSHPEPAYVERVATAFETGVFVAPDGTRFGTTGRGDMKATLAAILLDPSQHDDPLIIRDTTDVGKVREPILSFIHWARAFEVSPPDSSIEDLLVFGTQNPVRSLGQQAFAAPSVFNFYRPRFIPNGTTAGDRNLTMPEMQLVDGALRTGYVNFMTTYVMGDSIKRAGENENNFLPDFSALIPLVDNSDLLINYLDELLFYGRMTDQTRLNMREVNDNVPIRSGSEAEDRKTRSELAVLVAVTSPEFQIQQ